MRYFFLPALIFCIFICGSSCKKDKHNNVTNPNNNNTGTTNLVTADSSYIDAIGTNGCNYAGEYIVCSYHISGTGSVAMKSMLWDFGDGSTSGNLLSPKHIYRDPGTYIISLTVNGTILTTSVTISAYLPGSPYTAAMAGSRRWVGSGYGLVNEFGGFLYGSPLLIDTTLTISVMNGGIIMLPCLGGMTPKLTGTDAINKVLTYTDCLNSTTAVHYYYEADSIVYTNSWSATVGHGYESLVMHTVR